MTQVFDVVEERKRVESQALAPSNLPALLFKTVKRVNTDVNGAVPHDLFWKCVVYREFDALRKTDWDVSNFVVSKLSNNAMESDGDADPSNRILHYETVDSVNIVSKKGKKKRADLARSVEELVPYDELEEAAKTNPDEKQFVPFVNLMLL